LIRSDNVLAIFPLLFLKVSSLKNKTLRIFQGCFTVQLSMFYIAVSHKVFRIIS
jgi:hypothetical protein